MKGKMKIINFTLILLTLLTTNLLAEKGFILKTTIHGESKGDGYGSEMCKLGDINQDGYDDLAIGARETMNGGTYVKIYFGGNPADTIADLRLSGKSYFGSSMDSGDFNGDGIPDLIVGAPCAYGSYGNVSIFYGGSNMDSLADISVDGTRYYGFFGYDVANGGDINGDGYEDFIVTEFTAGDVKGYFYIFWGGPNVDNIWEYCLIGKLYDIIGCSCDGIGDINQDGFDDVIVGAMTQNFGKAYIIYGNTVISDSSVVEILGDTTKEYGFGRLTIGIGDINNDSIPEFAITAHEISTNNGVAHIYSGNSLEPIFETKFNKPEPHYNNPICYISKNIDYNNDNIDDLIISTSSNFAYNMQYFTGGDDFDTIPTRFGLEVHERFGYSFCEIGNFNGDGKQYIAIGEPGFFYVSDTSNLKKGKVHIYYFGELSDINVGSNNDFILINNYPNPFNNSTNIELNLSKSTKIKLKIFDIKGNIIEILENNYLKKGKHKYLFNASNLSSGIYFYNLIIEEKSYTKKMILLK